MRITDKNTLKIDRMHPWLAPLAGHSDLAFRVLCREYGAAVACTEMISAKGLVYGQRNHKGGNATRDLLLSTPVPGFPAGNDADSPLVVQLFGDVPVFLAEAVSILREWGFTYFDLNMGCSVPKVLKTGAGAALARNVSMALKAAEAMLEAAGSCPVGFKFRLGWSQEEENYLELGRALAHAGAAWLTLHPRYARQAFGGKADWPALAALKNCVNIPIIASGDLFCAVDAQACLASSGADTVMFARGAMYNPAVFADYLALARNGTGAKDPDMRIKALRAKQMILRHAELVQAMPCQMRGKHKLSASPAGLMKLRGGVMRYMKELPGSRLFRQALATCACWEEFYGLVEDYFKG